MRASGVYGISMSGQHALRDSTITPHQHGFSTLSPNILMKDIFKEESNPLIMKKNSSFSIDFWINNYDFIKIEIQL